MLKIANIESLIGNCDRKPIEITGDLCQLEGQPITLTLESWKFHDWRPRDEWFQIESSIQGAVHRLKIYLSPHDRLEPQSLQWLFSIGSELNHPKICIEGVVSGNSTLSTGLFVAILRASII